MLNRGCSQPIRKAHPRTNQSVRSKCHSETHSRSTPYCYNGYKFQVLVIVKEGNLGCYLAVVEGLITCFFNTRLVVNTNVLSNTWLYIHAQMMEISNNLKLFFWENLISKLDVFCKNSMNSTFHVILKSVSRPCSIQIRFSQIFNL